MRGYRITERQDVRDHFTWRSLGAILPFLWEYRGRALLALVFLVLAKVSLIGVPLLLKEIIELFESGDTALVALPVGLIAGYGLLRLLSSLFNEVRDAVFARVRYHAMRRLSTRVLTHLHGLSLQYHMERQTGAISRDLDRGARGSGGVPTQPAVGPAPGGNAAVVAGNLVRWTRCVTRRRCRRVLLRVPLHYVR